MKGISTWSYHPYKPLLRDTGDIYICRVAPDDSSVHLEWLAEEGTSCLIYYRKPGEGTFTLSGAADSNEWDITGLETDTDYEFYAACGDKKSRIRLARTGKAVGTVVNYLHPDDEAYSFSGRYLCSPSLVRHPDGYLLASMDLFASEHPQNLTLIFRSDDDGETCRYVSELMPCFWGKLFIHQNELYMLSCSTEYGDLLIGKSVDGGKTFSPPITLLRGSNGKRGNDGVHKNPQNIVRHNGRIYNTLEWGTWANKEFCHAAMVMSIDENADLLNPENWHFTEPVKFARFAPELSDMPLCTMTIEGTIVNAPDGKLLNIMRFGKYGQALAYEIDLSDPDAPLSYSRLIPFPGNFSKFMIKYDEESGFYYSIATIAYDPNNHSARNLLSLVRSKDLINWETAVDLMDFRDQDPGKIGFQYVDFEIEGDDILYLCRTAMNQAHNFHDANYSTFHRIRNFRSL
ncbi:MAG: hypothetical protein IJC48_09500 [Clostridia bacterium]|nr:hypothetical protein [Clostridia bacterium]